MAFMRALTKTGFWLCILLLAACSAGTPIETPDEEYPPQAPEIEGPPTEAPAEKESAEEEPAEEEPAVKTPSPADPMQNPDRESEPSPEPTADRDKREELGGEEKLPERVPTVEAQEAVVGEVPEGLMNVVIDDLVQRTGTSPAEIEVIRAEQAIWNDGSLGCPKPGEMYTQAIVRGYWINLVYNGEMYDYRANEGGYFFLCESPVPGSGGAPTG